MSEAKGKAAQVLEHQDGSAEQLLTDIDSTSSITKRQEDFKMNFDFLKRVYMRYNEKQLRGHWLTYCRKCKAKNENGTGWKNSGGMWSGSSGSRRKSASFEVPKV